jgi:NADH:ubiquinone oxidoreductase subunit C
MLENEKTATVGNLVDEVKKLQDEGFRFLTATCLDMGEGFEVLYHFDRELTPLNLRVAFKKEETLPSISGLFLCSILIENEIKELFGCNISGLAVDFGGKLFTTEDGPTLPMIKSMKVTISEN